ncbi:hypothetical protein [Sebaldella sp. S0638]|uniref:hypothetical protein n=1 Tax=Sebaldella sp. S0638 TaxID=2957809 RepID=UPI00209E2C24|nr:hypothetical protein [Sebaldella sp. S0638]MCP1226669.1 hypothetical protein [Sebaldella sp. S0638]
MAKKNINVIDRSKDKPASVSEKKANIEKKYDNEKLKVDNKNPDNKDLRNTGRHIKEEIQKNESPVIPEQKITDIRTYGSDKDYIVVELVGKYRNMWNYLTKPEVIRRIKENSKDIEIIPIEYNFTESKEVEFLFSQLNEIFLNGVSTEVSMENLQKFGDRHGEILSKAILELMTENMVQLKKYQAGILTIHMLGRV